MLKSKHRRIRPIVDCCEDPTPRQVHRAAVAYLKTGLSFIPISADGTKQPAFELLPLVPRGESGVFKRSWGIFKQRQPTRDEVDAWFKERYCCPGYGMAVLGGAVSGGLEIIDFDTADLFEPWAKIVRKKAPRLLDKLVLVETPRPGVHAYFRSKACGGNCKLARIPIRPQGEKKWKAKTLIEVKGEGGYCLAPPSPGECHPRRTCYTFETDKDLTQIAVITAKERQILFEAARSFDKWEEHLRENRPWTQRRSQSGAASGGRPGDYFNARANWPDILQPHGWSLEGDDGGSIDYWCRPGKTSGISATTNYEDSDLFYVFSSNADPFDQDRAYTKFHAYALLEHDGDFSAAARALARRGYGQRKKRRPRRRSITGLRERYSHCKLRSFRQRKAR
jgi:hypothetical protein